MNSFYIPIVPLPDGNGRTGRLILFRECLRHKIMPVVIEDANRNEYLECLKEYREKGKTEPLTALFKKEQLVYWKKCGYFMGNDREDPDQST